MKFLLCTIVINLFFIERPQIGSHGFEELRRLW